MKEYADSLGWDWRLLASQVYQESQFDPGAESWAGAHGLMQLLPTTAQAMGIKDMNDPRESIIGGTRYLKQLQKRFDDIPDSLQRIKFAMASFNCGYAHVRDAQRLASNQGKDTVIWDGNVEDALLALSYPKYYTLPIIKYGHVRGIEPYTYVKQIFDRYDHYLNFMENEDGEEDE
jgi:membrane-bound lytic murein transglycosylase F